MKRIALFVLLIALFAVGAAAVQVSSPIFGGENQDRIGVTTTFTITNNNTANLTNIAISPGNGAENAKYALSFSGVPSSLAPGASAVVTINGTVPLDHSGVDSTSLNEMALKIGTLTVSGTAGSVSDSASADVMMQAINQLEIKKVRIECGDKSQSLDSGDRVKNLKPGNSCTLEIQVENNFDDDDTNNQKIGDISFSSIDINVDTSSRDVDVDEEDDLDDLDAGDTDSVNFDIDIDEEADDGTISFTIRVSGRDENGALHGETLDFKLEVNRLTHDVQIQRMELSPSLVNGCDGSNVKLTVSILNQGKRDEDEAAIEVSVPDLKFIKKIEAIELERDDSTTVTFDIPVPKASKDGVVRVDVKTYFDTLAPSNSGSVELIIDECIVEEEPVVPVNKTTVVVPQVTPVTPSAGQTQAAPKKTASFTESQAYVGLLAVLSVLIAIAIVALVVMIVRKKPQ